MKHRRSRMFHVFLRRFILFALVAMRVTTARENDQVQAVVRERVNSFMSLPVTALETFADYFELGGFANNLQATDRDEATKYLFSIVNGLESTGLKPYYGLENGLLLGFMHSALDLVPRLVYREPGNSGFFEGDEDLAIYMPSCVDDETGDEEMCLMDEGDPYISCINNCALIPCPGSDAGESGFITPQTCSILPVEQRAECESRRKWCRNYRIEETQVWGTRRRGFVPRSASCMNALGEFSQTPGEILQETPSGAVTNGICTFRSGALVERTLSGPFAYCATYPSGECSETFVGAHESTNYDPRWREWYMASKAAQRPRFSDPYIFFDFGHVGITYTHPIYERDNRGRSVFAGVLAVDMVLADISNFLVEYFNETGYYVGVLEDREPHYMIGVSTGTSLVRKVVRDDPSQACSLDQEKNGECDAIQLTINDFASSPEDDVLRKANLELENFPGRTVTVRENDDDIDSTSYMATSLVYEQPGKNLRWRIVVASEIGVDEEDAITLGSNSFIMVCALGVLGFILCFTLFVLFWQRRNEKAVQFADVSFTSAFIVGCALLNLSSLAQLGENTDELCLIRMWTFWFLSAFCLSPLLVKAFRTWKLLGASVSSALSVKMNNFQAWLRSLPVPIVQTIILLIFTFADPPLATETIDWNSSTVVKGVSCQHSTSAFYIIQGIFDLILIITGCSLAYLTRNIDPRFGDARALLFAMYNIAFTAVMLSVIFLSVDITVTGRRVLQAIGVFWATVFSSAAFIVPRLMAANEEQRKANRERETLRKTMLPRNVKFSFASDTSEMLHSSQESLKLLVCSANVGNAEPTLSSMRAWIPEEGRCADVKPLGGARIDAEKFDLIVVGMQEATWGASKKKKDSNRDPLLEDESQRTVKESLDDSENSAKFGTINIDKLEKEDNDDAMSKEDAFMAAVEGMDTFTLRKMMKSVLGEEYKSIAEETRGQMRLYVWARHQMAPYIDEVKVSGANTGIGNVMANKGGIVVSLKCMDTRFTFLSAHLAAHEGESYYKSRCDNVYDILRSSKTFELSHTFDLALSSHHMFVLGDLNFRTKFDMECEHKENVKRALDLVKAQDWRKLYSYDELHKGIKEGHLLVNFKTLPCNFHPTFKMNRKPGFDYKQQRTPSYTDRIVFRSSLNLKKNLKPLAYEPCVDFITSDHKPVRGAFSIVPNDIIEHSIADKFRLVFSELECSDLLAADVEGYSDPYVMFVWDGIDMHEDKAAKFSWRKSEKWPRTPHKTKTLNPKWKDKKISLITTGEFVDAHALLFVTVFDYDFMSESDILGTLPLSMQGIVAMEEGQRSKEINFDRPLERFGKLGGRIKFKLEVFKITG